MSMEYIVTDRKHNNKAYSTWHAQHNVFVTCIMMLTFVYWWAFLSRCDVWVLSNPKNDRLSSEKHVFDLSFEWLILVAYLFNKLLYYHKIKSANVSVLSKKLSWFSFPMNSSSLADDISFIFFFYILKAGWSDFVSIFMYTFKQWIFLKCVL